MKETKRIYSIDALRGFIILLMLFVNDFAGVKNGPAWLYHVGFNKDGMNVPDIVFPAFLFIMGMSIPLAFAKRLNGDNYNFTGLMKHIGIRVFSLLIIGVFMVNSHSCTYPQEYMVLLWKTFVFGAFFLIWPIIPIRVKSFNLKYLGWIILFAAAILYSDGKTEGFITMRPRWWGILALLGWAYLWSALVYIAGKGSKSIILGCIILFYLFFFAYEYGFAKNFILSKWINLGGFWGSHSALTLSGTLFTILIQDDFFNFKKNLKKTLIFILFTFTAGFFIHYLRELHPMFIINKISATPAWCLYSSSVTAALWALFYLGIDKMKWENKNGFFVLAGQNALFVYIFYSCAMIFIHWLILLTGKNFYHSLVQNTISGFIRALIFSFLITWFASFLKKKGFGLKL